MRLLLAAALSITLIGTGPAVDRADAHPKRHARASQPSTPPAVAAAPDKDAAVGGACACAGRGTCCNAAPEAATPPVKPPEKKACGCGRKP